MLALPVVLWQLWRFITPGLHPREKRYAIPFVGSSIVLFSSGAALAYLTFSKALSFLSSIGGAELRGDLQPVEVPAADPADVLRLRARRSSSRSCSWCSSWPAWSRSTRLRSWRRQAFLIIVDLRGGDHAESGPVHAVRHGRTRCTSSTRSRSSSAGCSRSDRRGGAGRPSRPRLGFPLDRFQRRGARRPRRRPVGAGRRADRLGQDRRRRVRRRPGPGRGRQGLLHDAAEGAVEPEVRRSRRPPRRRHSVGLLTGDNSIRPERRSW